MSWVEIRKKGIKKTHIVTEEAFNDVFKENGFEIVNKDENNDSTTNGGTVRENAQPKAEIPQKRQYAKRNNGA